MTERDLLISRIVDRAESPEDWDRLDALANRDRAVYDSLLASLRDDSGLRFAVAPQLAVADGVELGAPGLLARYPWLPQWSGWLTVAGLLLAWLLVGTRAQELPRASDVGAEVATRAETATPEDAGGAVVLRELPNLMVETRAIAGSDQTEVIYVHRTLKRAVIGAAYTLARDEIGQPVQARVDLSRFAPQRSY